jgi:hypothetical protein
VAAGSRWCGRDGLVCDQARRLIYFTLAAKGFGKHVNENEHWCLGVMRRP